MYCKNCGAANDDNAKFCGSCGSKIEQAKPVEDAFQDFYDEPQRDNNYDYQDSHSDNSYHNSQPSNIYGKQFEAHAQGNMSYGNKSNPLGKIIGFVFIIGIIVFVYFTFLASDGPIYDVQIGSEVNPETYYPNDPLDYVIASDGILYVSYSARDIQYETVNVSIYEVHSNYYIVYSDSIYMNYDEQVGYFSYDYNWTVGSYEIDFELDGETIYTLTFEVETE